MYHSSTVGVKTGFSAVRIRLRKLLFWGWLELEGAKAVPVTQE
ncbi:MAG: hypothetical protein P4N41_10510 [Negativicutes bacterium]|nr:hypothetical protein [Negativicutes bacterium]